MFVRALEDLTFVERHIFGLTDAENDRLPRPWPEGDLGKSWIKSEVGRIDFTSPGVDHEALVRLELWGSEPPQQPGESWEIREDLPFDCPSGRVIVQQLEAGPSDSTFVLYGPGMYHVRVHRSGSEEVVRLLEDSDMDDLPEGVERYLLQFWRIDGA